MLSISRSAIFVFLFFAALKPTALLAQSTGDGLIRGQVLDPQGVVLPGVSLTAKSADGSDARTAVSDGAGKWEFAVPAGRAYTISGELPGFSPFAQPGVEVATGQILNLDIQLRLAPLSETVTVLGDQMTRVRDSVERLQDVPLSVSIVTGKELDRLVATDISALTQRAANVTWNFGNQRTSSLSIRGVGKQGQTEAQDPSVGVIVDGVNYAYNALTSSYDFTDVDTVEVTRGPQGTLLGKKHQPGCS